MKQGEAEANQDYSNPEEMSLSLQNSARMYLRKLQFTNTFSRMWAGKRRPRKMFLPLTLLPPDNMLAARDWPLMCMQSTLINKSEACGCASMFGSLTLLSFTSFKNDDVWVVFRFNLASRLFTNTRDRQQVTFRWVRPAQVFHL